MTTPAIDWACWRDASHQPINKTMFGWPKCTVCGAAPAYHERPDYLVPGFALGLYVPIPDEPRTGFIARGSGVVGLPDGLQANNPHSRTTVYFEGWVNGPMQYAGRDARGLWEAGVEHAASRMICAYPTVAQASLPSNLLIGIGLYYPAQKRIEIAFEGQEVLDAWLNQ